MAVGSHQSSKPTTNEWITPPEIIEALGPFDLDPCAAKRQPWPTAKQHFTIDDDGLAKQWFGRVWLNPPYSSHSTKFMLKMSEYGNGIALIFARTETRMFFHTVWNSPNLSGILFLKGRLTFYKVDGTKGSGNSGAPSVLIAYGKENAEVLEHCDIPGKFISFVL